jgi:hypothetical protein
LQKKQNRKISCKCSVKVSGSSSSSYQAASEEVNQQFQRRLHGSFRRGYTVGAAGVIQQFQQRLYSNFNRGYTAVLAVSAEVLYSNFSGRDTVVSAEVI